MKRVRTVACAVLSLAVCIPAPIGASVITDVTPFHAPTSGGVTITIIGSDFGAAGNSVSLGGRECAITAESPGQIECTVPEGSGAFQPLRVSDGTGTSSPPFAFAYDAPEITSVMPASASSRGGTLTINGVSFGPGTSARSVSVGGVDCPLVPGAPSSHAQLVCTAPPGQGTNVPITVTVDGQRAIPWVAWSYDAPTITNVAPTSAPAAGSIPITIYGTNFGLEASATVGGAPCPIETQTHETIECTLPPGTGTSAVSVVVAGQASNEGSVFRGHVPSKCDAGKWKAAGGLAKCVAGIRAKGSASKEQDEATRAAAEANCEAKFDKAFTKSEGEPDCSQSGNGSEIKVKIRGWDGQIRSHIN